MRFLSHEQELVVRRLKRVVQAAAKAGLTVVADSDTVAIRLIPKNELADSADLRDLGEVVEVHDACGGDGSSQNPNRSRDVHV